MTQVTNIMKAARKLLNQFEVKSDEDKGYWVCFKTESIENDNEYYRALSDIINDTLASREFLYTTVYDFLEWIIDSEIEDTDHARDSIYEFCDYQTPVYTSDLTDWLAQSNYHVYWLEDAVTEHGQTEGFKILSSAYYLAVQEVAYSVLSVIEDI